jgi:hypothetical protein
MTKSIGPILAKFSAPIKVMLLGKGVDNPVWLMLVTNGDTFIATS